MKRNGELEAKDIRIGDLERREWRNRMKHYLYPQNLRAKANLWLWGMKDFIILSIAVLISIVLLVKLGCLLPAAFTLAFAFLTIRKDDMTILEYMKYAARYFLTEQQYYEWR